MESDPAFEFGRKFSKIVRDFRGRKRVDPSLKMSVLAEELRAHCGVSAAHAQKLAVKAYGSDRNMTALCVMDRLLSVSELEQMADAKGGFDAFLWKLRYRQ